jgi:PAS domain S-box-containing protein
LAESQAFAPLLDAIEQAPVGVAIFDRDLRYLAASRRYLADIGVESNGSIVGRSHFEIFPDTPPRWREALQHGLAGETLSAEEDVYHRPDGKVDWIRWSLTPWRTPTGELGGIVLYSEVITALVEERMKLEAAEAKYRGIFHQAAVGVALVAVNGTFLEVNDRACAVSGWNREELLSLTVEQITHPDDLQADLELARALIAGEIATYSLQKRYLMKGGGYVWVNVTVSLVRDVAGAPAWFVAIIEDISERKATEEALRAGEARSREQLEELEAIYETSPVGLAFLTPDLRYVRVNRRLAEMNGVPAVEHLGRTVAEVVPNIAEPVGEIVRRLRESEAVVSYEVSGETAAAPGMAGSWLTYWVPLRREDGSLRGYNVVVEDVTDRKLEEDRRKLLVDELNHRVRNTLAVVQSIARQTLAGHAGAEAREAFEERLYALAAAHNILTRENWTAADLKEVIVAAAGSQAAQRLRLDGPPVALPPSVAVTLSLALHELGTNATKYGALSIPTGHVDIFWTITGPRRSRLKMRWEEINGPPVLQPKRKGFGTRLLQRALRAELGGAAKLEFAPAGVICELECELGRSI